MSVNMQATMKDNTEAVLFAQRLLPLQKSILVVSHDVAPFAMLVNHYGDFIHTVEILGGACADRAAIVEYAYNCEEHIDALILVAQPQ